MPVTDSQPVPTVVEVTDASLTSAAARIVAAGFTGSDGEYTVEASARQVLDDLRVDVFALLDRACAKGDAGETVTHDLFGEKMPQRVILVGLGSQSGQDYRRAGAALARLAVGGGRLATSVAAHADDVATDAFVEGLVLGAFGFHRKSDKQAPPQRPVVVLSDLPK
ncbi:MAG: hypothetical protein H0T17_00435, partial [Propionibacteriales bacterium]|nr:hypothetical protein [Propionibacteriales bacterium]